MTEAIILIATEEAEPLNVWGQLLVGVLPFVLIAVVLFIFFRIVNKNNRGLKSMAEMQRLTIEHYESLEKSQKEIADQLKSISESIEQLKQNDQ